MKLTRIHINGQVLRRNRKTGERNPAISVKRGKTNTRAYEVEINGPCKVVYRPEKPLSCGAVCWVETSAEVTAK